ncbi:MAG TPA: hypothetical protein VF529_17085 [Solirubrobacteraceae bacterium]|jgi:hypothetical protein
MRFDSPSFEHARHARESLAAAWDRGGVAPLAAELVAQRRRVVQWGRVVRELPWMHLWIGSGPAADEIWRRTGPRVCALTGRRPARAVLIVPPDPADYLRGRTRQALRTNRTRSRRLGIACRRVDGGAEKRALLLEHLRSRREDVDTFEREQRIRVEDAEVHVAERDGAIEAIAMVYVAAEAAYLAYLRAGLDERYSSAARYALSAAVTQSLSARGVRAQISGSALGVDPGTAYLQQRLGYSIGNVYLDRTARLAAAPPQLVLAAHTAAAQELAAL